MMMILYNAYTQQYFFLFTIDGDVLGCIFYKDGSQLR